MSAPNSGPQNMQEAYNLVLEQEDHLLGIMVLTPSGEMHYQGFVPLDVLMAALKQNPDMYLPTEEDKANLRLDKKVTNYIAVPHDAWMTIMGSQMTESSVAGVPVLHVPTTMYENEKIRTFTLD